MGDDSDLIVTWLPKAILVCGALYTEECKGMTQHRRVRLKGARQPMMEMHSIFCFRTHLLENYRKKKSHLYIQLYSERVCNLDSINFQT